MVQSCLATIFLGKLLGHQLRCWPLTRLVMTGQFFKKHLGWAQMRKGLGSNIEATEWTSVTSLCSSLACVNLDRFDCLPFETSRYTMFLLSTNGALRCFESLVLTGSRKIKLNDVLVDWSKQDRCWCQICLITPYYWNGWSGISIPSSPPCWAICPWPNFIRINNQLGCCDVLVGFLIPSYFFFTCAACRFKSCLFVWRTCLTCNLLRPERRVERGQSGHAVCLRCDMIKQSGHCVHI